MANLHNNPVTKGETRHIKILLELTMDEDIAKSHSVEIERLSPLLESLMSDELE